jgi:hypothetical protein
MRISTNPERGTVLVTTLVITGLVTIAVAALLMIVNQQNYFSARSQTWSSEIPIAEAGIEEAMAHVNSRPKTFEMHGWTLAGTNVVKRRTVGDGYFYTAISTAKPPVIVSVGFGRIPLQTNYTQRTVMALTKRTRPYYGILARRMISMGGSGSDWPWIDAFDSSDDDYSSPGYPGRYDPKQRKDDVGVATLSNLPGAINTGSGEIWGYAATAPGGTVIGNVGDGGWLLNNTGIQTNHVRNDYNGTITNAVLPTTSWTTLDVTKNLTGTRDFKHDGDLTTGFVVNQNAKVRVWITGDVQLTGKDDAISIGTNATLELYVAGSAHFGGNGVLNGAGVSTACKLIGLPTCTAMKYAGSVDMVAAIYAPNATVTINGGVDVYGSITADILNCSGSSGIHYDEALGRDTGPAWTIFRWEEL